MLAGVRSQEDTEDSAEVLPARFSSPYYTNVTDRDVVDDGIIVSRYYGGSFKVEDQSEATLMMPLQKGEQGSLTEAAPLTFNPAGYVCVICDTLLEEIHCKLNCPNCGAMRDCSDP